MSIITEIKPLSDAGFSVHWLRPQSKAPADSAWSTIPVKSYAELQRDYRPDNNVGVRLGEWSKVGGGYLHVIDLDVRNEDLVDEAHARLGELFPGYEKLPYVISGSGGESRHYYFITDKPFASKKLAVSSGHEMVFEKSKGRPVKKSDWEIDLFGGTKESCKQVAMPPSVHPETGAEYTWGREFDLDMIDLGITPSYPSSLIAGIEGVSDAASTGEVDGRPPLGLTIKQAQEHLDGLPLSEWCEDRDGWFQVGMALHHEFAARGLEGEAFELWCKFSGQSEKFDLNNARVVWKSFKDAKSRNIRMATIVQAARHARFEDKFSAIIDGSQGDGFDEPESAESKPAASDKAGPASGLDDLLGTPSDSPASDPLDDLDDLVEKKKTTETNSIAWMEKLDYTDDGGIRPTLPNIRLIVANDIRSKGVVAYNQFSEGLVRMGVPGKLRKKRDGPQGTKQLDGAIWEHKDTVNGDLWRDVHDHAIRDLIETPGRMGGYSVKVSDRDLSAAISMAANDRLFHPVREYLDKLEWDGVERLDTLFIRYFGSPDTSYSRSVARMMMTGGVTRIYEPGHKFDYAVILEGMQGKRKTTFIETLAQNWFGELASEFDNTNKMIESMQNAWIIEIPELSGFSKGDVQSIKAFISRRVDRARLAWAKRPQDYHRQCIFIGSTNDAKYLRDETGGRRFWPIECLLDDDDNIDIETLREEVSQLWAEAKANYLAMREKQPHGPLPLYLSDEQAAKQAEQMQESRRVETLEDIQAGQIETWLNTPISADDGFGSDEKVYRNMTCLKIIWIEALGNDPRSLTAQNAQSLGRTMRRVPGWDSRAGKIREFGKYGRQRAYFRSNKDERFNSSKAVF